MIREIVVSYLQGLIVVAVVGGIAIAFAVLGYYAEGAFAHEEARARATMSDRRQRIEACSKAGGIPIFDDYTLKLSRCDFPPVPCQ